MYINYVVNFFLEGLDWIVSRGAPPPLPQSQVMYTKHCTRKRAIFNCCCFMFTIRRKDINFFKYGVTKMNI